MSRGANSESERSFPREYAAPFADLSKALNAASPPQSRARQAPGAAEGRGVPAGGGARRLVVAEEPRQVVAGDFLERELRAANEDVGPTLRARLLRLLGRLRCCSSCCFSTDSSRCCSLLPLPALAAGSSFFCSLLLLSCCCNTLLLRPLLP